MSWSDPELAALAGRVGTVLVARGETVATAESCTGGWIAKAMTDLPGSSAWFCAGLVTYSNAAKGALLGVPAAAIAAHGAVSEPVVRAMAAGCLARTGAVHAVAVSGIAGPGGGTPAKPVGTVWFAFASPDSIVAEAQVFAGDREAVRRLAVAHALESLLVRLGATR